MTVSASAVTGRSSTKLGLRTLLARRIRERRFWMVQAGVVTATLVHMTVEAFDLLDVESELIRALAHLPVILYLAPVLYAGLQYGYEGGLLTGVWSGSLALPNLLIWHRDGYSWVGEVSLLTVVVGLGVFTALPVERERLERRRAEDAHRRAEATSRQLALANRITSMLVATNDVEGMLAAALDQLVDAAGVVCAGIHVPGSAGEPGLDVVRSPDPDRAAAFVDTVRAAANWSRNGRTVVRDRVTAAPLSATGAELGALVVKFEHATEGRTASTALIGGIARQIGVAIENVRLQQQEEARLRSYVREITRAQEEERRRVSRELHDGTAQDLVLLGRLLDELIDEARAERRSSAELLRVRETSREILDSVRRFSRDLRPSVLDDLGLIPALEWLVADLMDRQDISAQFQQDGEPRRLAAETELALFRITQEALNNVQHHAHAEAVRVRISFNGEEVALTVEDDGRGFDPASLSALARSSRLGLLGMRERAQLVGGRMSVESRPGEGTRVAVSVRA